MNLGRGFQLFVFLTLMGVLSSFAVAQDRSQARSVVMTRYGIVAAESPLAAQAGARVLEQGGSAVDAAVAANAVMGVVEPMMDGIGGDLFAIVYDAKSGKLYGLNASGWAPTGLSLDFLKNQAISSMPQRGINSVTVPGAVDGWSKLLERFGRRKLADDLSPAIHYAQEGFPVPEMAAAYWAASQPFVTADANAASTFLPGGRPPQAGDVFRNPDLARSLQAIASGGRNAFYSGDIAHRIVAYSERVGGTMSAADLAEYSSEWVEPVSTTYHGWTIYELPPNGQGIAALEMLNIMEQFPLGEVRP